MANVLVTGGAGFIGSHLVRALIKEGHQVRVLDDFSTGYIDNLEEIQRRIELIDGDIRRPVVVKPAMRKVDLVFHLAALASVQRSIKDPISTTHVNALGTLNVFEAARAARVQRVVYASSSSVYGDSLEAIRRETNTTSPMSPYALSKLVGEQYGSFYSKTFGLETVGLRFFNVFGPRQDPSSQYSAAIPKFIAALTAGEASVIYGDGKQSRDFTYVENVVQANLLAARVPGISGRLFNVGCGESITVNDLYWSLVKLMKIDVPARYQPARTGDVRHSQADISLAKKLLGYAPTVDVQEGLRRTVTWFQSAEGTLRLAATRRRPAQTVAVGR